MGGIESLLDYSCMVEKQLLGDELSMNANDVQKLETKLEKSLKGVKSLRVSCE
ncbi:hypothetical protein Hanom_Chr15g01408341 [Helianthus anomalus]